MNQTELHTIAPTLASIKREDCFVIPEQYFENFALNVEYLLLLHKQENFNVEEAYFKNLPDAVNNLLLLKKQELFNAPEGYFEALQEQVAAKTFQLEKTTLAAPKGYFDSLPRMVQQRIYEEEHTKKWFVFEPQFRYALATIAACFIVFIGVKFFFNTDKNKPIAMTKTSVKSNESSTQVSIISTNKGLDIKVSESTQKEIVKHVDEQLIQGIDENMLVDELAIADDNTNNSNEKINNEIQDFLLENNVDESILIDAVN